VDNYSRTKTELELARTVAAYAGSEWIINLSQSVVLFSAVTPACCAATRKRTCRHSQID